METVECSRSLVDNSGTPRPQASNPSCLNFNTSHQHSPFDLSTYLTAEYAARITQLVASTAASLARAPSAPRNIGVAGDLDLTPGESFFISVAAVDEAGHASLFAYPECRCDATGCAVPRARSRWCSSSSRHGSPCGARDPAGAGMSVVLSLPRWVRLVAARQRQREQVPFRVDRW